MKKWIALFIVAGLFRLVGLADYPSDFTMDEAANGYYAYSLIHGGYDEYGNRYPVFFPSNGDFKLAGYAFITVPAVALLGLSEASTRLPNAVLGICGVMLISYLAARTARNSRVGWWVGLVYAVTPWAWMMARGAFEVQAGVTLALAWWVCVTKGFEKKQWWLSASVILFSCGVYTYPAVRLLLLGAGTLMIGVGLKKRKWPVVIACGLAVIIGSLGFLDPGSRIRSSQTVVWNANMDEITAEQKIKIHDDGIAAVHLPVIVTRALHNRAVGVVRSIGDRYIEYFSADYLLKKGDSRPGYALMGIGPVLVVSAFGGVVGLLTRGFKRLKLLAGAIWTVGTVPAALTSEHFHSVRHFPAVVGIVMLAGLGMYILWKRFKKLRWVLLVAFVVNVGMAVETYAIHKEVFQPWYGDSVMQEVIETSLPMVGAGKTLVMPKDQYIFWAFYGKIAPDQFRKDLVVGATMDPYAWERVTKWKTVYFKMPSDCPKLGKLDVIYVCRGAEVPVNSDVQTFVRFADGQPAVTWITFFPLGQKKPDPLPEGLSRMKDVDTRFNKEGLLPRDYPTLWL